MACNGGCRAKSMDLVVHRERFFISGADPNRGQQRVCLAYAKIKSLNRGDFGTHRGFSSSDFSDKDLGFPFFFPVEISGFAGAKKKVRSQRGFNPVRKQWRPVC
ncbi:hypothetical protein U1Q18_028294 [Sarracenia purpurea var. burkii]